jgi:cation:H+ antiporter
MLFWYIVAFMGCVGLLFFSSKIVYTQVLGLAKALHVPTFFISLIVLAVSTSIPELFVGITSALDGLPAFSLGDVLGSNIVNLTFIAGLVIVLSGKRIHFSRSIDKKQLIVTFGFALAPVALILDGELSRIDGFSLLVLYVLYLVYVAIGQKTTHLNAQGTRPKLLRPILGFVAGITLLILASQGIIHIATFITSSLSLTPFIVGVFAIAFSTSLPELTFGIRAALQGTPELSLADVVGATAVNATFILGIVALIHPIVPLVLSSVLMTGVFNVLVFVVFFFLVGDRKVSRFQGLLLLLLYFAFVSFNFF